MALRHGASAGNIFPMALRSGALAGQQLCLGAPASSSFLMALRHGAPGQHHLPDGAPPQRLGRQQTSFGGEKYSGLASNLAHLDRIC